MNTNTIAGWVEQVQSVVSQLYSLPSAAIVGLTCIVVGYTLKRINSFPNQAIPTVVILWGALFCFMLAPKMPPDVSLVAWRIKNALVGLIVGFSAWAFHYYLLSRLEDRFPWLKNLLSGSDGPQPEAPKP